MRADPQSQATTATSPPRLNVAVVGSGPAGFYAAEALLRAAEVAAHVDMFDRLPTPFGLVRGGVAPDHQKIKGVTRVYDKTAASHRFRFFGNVQIGRELSADDLRQAYDSVIYAVGAETGRDLHVPGRGATGHTPAAVFVGWYNGHPDFQTAKFDLSGKRAAVIGNDNVAIDVARILARDVEDLRSTDIAAQALSVLSASKIEEVWVIGRRGPVQAAFSPVELRELRELRNVSVCVDPADLTLDPASQAILDAADPTSNVARNVALLREIAADDARAGDRQIRLLFLRSPTRVHVDDDGRVAGIRLARNRLEARPDGSVGAVTTDDVSDVDIQLLVPAVGFCTAPLPGVAYDAKRRRIANDDGRVIDPETGAVLPNEYVVGWARTGPQGLIGAHRAASREVVARLVADRSAGGAEPAAGQGAAADGIHRDVAAPLLAKIAASGVQVTTFADWQRLNAIEVERGKLRGAPRDKIDTIDQMISLIAD